MPKHFTTLLFAILLPLCLNAQPSYEYPATVRERVRLADMGNNIQKFEEGQRLTLLGEELKRSAAYPGSPFRVKAGEGLYLASQKDLSALEFETEALSLDGLWRLHYLQSTAVEAFERHGWDFELRRELDEEYERFYQSLELHHDPFLSDYLNRLLQKAAPQNLPSRHPAILRTVLFKDHEPAALSCADGRIFLSTGLLSTLQHEDELIAILANEIAHIYFDHAVSNFRAIEQKEARAAFWAGLATLAAATVETWAATESIRNGTFTPIDFLAFGNFTGSVSFLSNTIAAAVVSRLGMEYTPPQRTEADNATLSVLKKLNLSEDALHRALLRIHEHHQAREGLPNSGSEQLFPALRPRINSLQPNGSSKAIPPPQPYFVQQTALARTLTAWAHFHQGQYGIARQLLALQQEARAMTCEDYLLFSALARHTTAETDGLQQALNMLQEAEQRFPLLPAELFLEKALLHQRLGSQENLKSALTAYYRALQETGRPGSSEKLWWAEQWLNRL